uniref:Uncharacterized protein n=1 Tax=viral metagenome TaxID=1070528 RepID=A0A6C0I2J6_9ZZZZ
MFELEVTDTILFYNILSVILLISGLLAYYLAKDKIDAWIGKTLLQMNMRDGAIYHDYGLQKGFFEKMFENMAIPQF